MKIEFKEPEWPNILQTRNTNFQDLKTCIHYDEPDQIQSP